MLQPERVLDEARRGTLINQGLATGMPQHVRVDFDG